MSCITTTLLLFISGAAGGALFALLHLPLPWTLGPLTVMLGIKFIGKRSIRWPTALRNVSLVILGIVMGSPFNLATANKILDQLPAIAGATVITIVVSLLIGYMTHRLTGIDLASSLLGSVPGGMTQMVLLSRELNKADATVVIFMQTTRMLSVLFVVPFLALHALGSNVQLLAGSAQQGIIISDVEILLSVGIVAAGTAIAVRIGMPTPWMVGPIIATAALVCTGVPPLPLPSWLIAVAQISTGIYLGSNIETIRMEHYNKPVLFTLVGAGGILACSFIIGIVLQYLLGYSLATAFLGTAPGGIAEMGLTAMMIQADLSVVIAYQMFRLLFILLVLPFALQWIFARI